MKAPVRSGRRDRAAKKKFFIVPGFALEIDDEGFNKVIKLCWLERRRGMRNKDDDKRHNGKPKGVKGRHRGR